MIMCEEYALVSNKSYDMCWFVPLGCIDFEFYLRDHRDIVDLFPCIGLSHFDA